MTKKIKIFFLFFLTSFLMLLFYPCLISVAEDGFENNFFSNVSPYEFHKTVIDSINHERSLKGLQPLLVDDLGNNVASNHAKFLTSKGYLSYFGNNFYVPDERYTDLGGTGAITEIIKGFESESEVHRNKLLAEQLVLALTVNEDDIKILFDPFITHIGIASYFSKDRKKFVSVIETITQVGSFEPLKNTAYIGEKINISGMINAPYKFKAVSIGYLSEDDYELEKENQINYIDNEALMAYFPPLDYVAYTDTTKQNLVNVLKGVGALGAIAASPFTGGATSVIAPFLLNSIRSDDPKVIPLRGGMKTFKNGSFSGEVPLNFDGMSGLYFVSILGERPGVDLPIVISRRTIKVLDS